MCFIVNDLTNRELISRKYTFEEPCFHKLIDRPNYDEQDEFAEDINAYGSTIFNGSEVSDIQNMHNLRMNEEAMKKSKDITST